MILEVSRSARSVKERILQTSLKRNPGVQIHPTARVRCALDTHIGPQGVLSVGRDSVIDRNCTLSVSGELLIGEAVFIAPMSSIGVAKSVSIGDAVAIGPGVVIVDGNKKRDGRGRPVLGEEPLAESIVIESHCWIGARAIILPGVMLAEGTTVGAGTVVSKSTFPGQTIVGGRNRKLP